MIAIDGLPTRGHYGAAAAAAAGVGGGSNGGPNMTAASFAAAAAAAAAASNGGTSSSSVTVPVLMMPGAVATSVHPAGLAQQPEAAAASATWGEMVRSRREYTLLKKVVQLLQDNRLKSGDEEAAEKLRELNRSQNESFPVLKTVLNAIFITTGVVLLIAVVVVIMYTSIVKNADETHLTDPSRPWPGSKPGSSSGNTADDLSLSNRSPGGGGGGGGGDNLLPVPNSPTQGIALKDESTRLHHSDRSRSSSDGYKKCRMVPIVQEGDQRVNFVQICFHVPPSSSSSSSVNDKQRTTTNRRATDAAAR